MILENERPSESLDQETEQANTCCHHWIIQPAVGPLNDRSCQNCGEVREFKNSIDYEAEWTDRREAARSKASSPIDSVEEAEAMSNRLIPSIRTRTLKSSNIGRKSQIS